MDAQVVYEENTAYVMDCGSHGYKRVGIRIEERVIWLACHYDSRTYDEYKRWHLIAHRIVDGLAEGG